MSKKTSFRVKQIIINFLFICKNIFVLSSENPTQPPRIRIMTPQIREQQLITLIQKQQGNRRLIQQELISRQQEIEEVYKRRLPQQLQQQNLMQVQKCRENLQKQLQFCRESEQQLQTQLEQLQKKEQKQSQKQQQFQYQQLQSQKQQQQEAQFQKIQAQNQKKQQQQEEA